MERHYTRAGTAGTETTYHRGCADDKNQREPNRYDRIPVEQHSSEKIHKTPASVNPLAVAFINFLPSTLT